MADPKDYSLVRLDDSIRDKAVLTYDATKDMIVDSGLLASQGELQAAAGTVSVGLQDMSSAGEQVVWRNRNTQINYAPPWHVLDEVNDGGSMDRFYGKLQTVTRFSANHDTVENPSFDVHVPLDEVVFRLKMDFVEAHPSVEFRVTQNGFEMWREVKAVSAGLQEITLDMPIAFHAGDFHFSIQAFNDNNTPVRIKGDLTTGQPAYDVVFRPFTEKQLATQEFALGHGGITGYMIKSVYDTDDDGVVDEAKWADWAKKVQGINSAGNSNYYGKDDTGTIGFFPLPAEADLSNIESEIKANKDEIAKHETAIEGHGTQLASHASQIATNTSNIKIAMQHSQSALDESNTVRKNGVNAIVAEVDNTHKTITLKLMSQTGLVDSALINLASWFSGGTPPQPGDDHKIYYGFTAKTTLPENEILRIGTTKEVSTIDSLDISMTRTGQTASYMWVWLPDSAGTIKGFDFSGFVSTWGSVAINVAGVNGKLYVSPNKTSATSIEFEVKV